MVMSADTCMGPRAYVGLASSYHQVVTEQLARMNDEAWAGRFHKSETSPEDVPWMKDLIAQ